MLAVTNGKQVLRLVQTEKIRSKSSRCINGLATLSPLLVKEWPDKNAIKPIDISLDSHNEVLVDFNGFASQLPQIAVEWSGSDKNLPLQPSMITSFVKSKVWWKCKVCGIYLMDEEYSNVIQLLIHLKNSLIAQGKHIDAVDDVLCKVLKVKKKKYNVIYIYGSAVCSLAGAAVFFVYRKPRDSRVVQ